MKRYDVNNEPIVLSKSVLDLLLNDNEPAEVLALYAFYYYTAKWQNTNQPKVTSDFTAKKLKWGIRKLQRIKQKLLDYHLIEDVKHFNENGKINGWFVYVRFIWSDDALAELNLTENKSTAAISTPVVKTDDANEKSTAAISTPVVKQRINAYSSLLNNKLPFSANKENALSAGIVSKRKNMKKEKVDPVQQFILKFPLNFINSKAFQQAIKDFWAHRQEKKKPLTQQAQVKLVNKLTKYPLLICISAIVHSIENGWTGIFPESENGLNDTVCNEPDELDEKFRKSK